MKFENTIRQDLVSNERAKNLSLNETIATLRAKGEKVHHLSFGQSPFSIPSFACEELAKHTSHGEYLPVAGIPSLRKAIVDFHNTLEGTELSADQVLVGPGSKQMLFLTMAVWGGEIAITSPCWTSYLPQARLAGKTPIVIETSSETSWKLTPELVEAALDQNRAQIGSKPVLLVIANPDNPTGAVYTAAEITALAAAFRTRSVAVLSDEIYRFLSFDESHASFATLYPEGTILSGGLSKWAAAGGWRLGYAIYPDSLKQLQESVSAAASQTHSCVAGPIQFAAVKLFEPSEPLMSYISHCKRILAAVASFTTRALSMVGVEAQLGHKPTGAEMCDVLMREARVSLLPGSAFQCGEMELTTRLCHVDFDGDAAYRASVELGLERPLPDSFVRDHCPRLAEGVDALVCWVTNHQMPVLGKVQQEEIA